MLPFYYSFYCELCETETSHLVYFVRYEKGKVLYLSVCCDCQEKAENLGFNQVDGFVFELEPETWWRLIPIIEFCEIAN